MVPATVLIVEDDDLSRDLLRLFLVREGFAVETAASGEEALQSLAGSTPAEVVLSDLQMPGISGPALAHHIRSISNPPRVVLAMSGSKPDEQDLEGYDGFLLKPFAMEAFVSAISAGASAIRTDAPVHIKSTGAVLDSTTYDKLKSSMNPLKLQQLYELCVDDVGRRVASMRLSAAAGDDVAYRREAHAIKGGCGLVGALELQSIAESEENAGIPANHVATLDEMLAAVERLKRILVAQ